MRLREEWEKGRSLARRLDRSQCKLDNLAELTHQILEGFFFTPQNLLSFLLMMEVKANLKQ